MDSKLGLKKWCPVAESNHRHGDFQSPALPTELSGRTKLRLDVSKRERIIIIALGTVKPLIQCLLNFSITVADINHPHRVQILEV